MSLLPSYKEIGDLIKKGATIEAQEKIMELREAAMQLQHDNLELKQRVKDLEDRLAVRGQVVWEAPFYWREQNGKRDGPYCQKCYDTDGKFIRLQVSSSGIGQCYTCRSTFHGKNDCPLVAKPRGSNRIP